MGGAERLKLQRHRSSTPATCASQQNDAANNPTNTDGTVVYQSLEILTPKNDTFASGQNGVVSVIVHPSPALASNHKLSVSLDGKVISSGRHTNLTLREVPRGTHTLNASISDESNKTLISSATITFHVKRPVIDKSSPLAFDKDES